MKRIILLLFAAVVAFSSCENLEDNSPALQSEIDSVFFKALDIRGQKNEDGSYTLQGVNQDQKLTLNIEKAQLGTYQLGGGMASNAVYIDEDDNEYTTAPFGQGQIEITDRCISCGWLTGTFNFLAKRSEFDSLPVIAEKGVFFEISFLNGNIDDGGPSLGTMTAVVDGTDFSANSLTITDTGGIITVTGFETTTSISIQIPSNAVSGNYVLPQAGYAATYTVDGVTTEADEGGVVTVNFNNTETRRFRVFFNFTAGARTITDGNTAGTY